MKLLILGSILIALANAETKKPNIIFIMADDLGPGWVDLDGTHEKINTPNLQRLAESGMIFNKAYAAASICSPTRAACITGMSPAQIGLTTHVPGKAGNERKGPKGSPEGAESAKFLPLDSPSYARELKKQGYATAFIGKWHLAGEGSISTKDGVINSAWHPEHYGFDSNIGGCAYGQPRPWFDPYKNATIKNRKKGEYLTDRLADEASIFIEANKDKPFHLTFWPYSVHTPIQAPKELVKKNNGSKFLAMLECLDNAVGTVLDTLEKTGTLDNTMVIFYSDNGGHFATDWLADKKGSLLEGGLRVPMVVSWPGIIKGGSTCDTPINSMDFFPTFVHAAGGSTSDITQLEGLDLKPLFQGADKLERDALFWHFPHNRTEVKYYMGGTVLAGDWKYYQGYGLIKDALFNLKDDPMEKNNVILEEADRARDLQSKLESWRKKIAAKMPRNQKAAPKTEATSGEKVSLFDGTTLKGWQSNQGVWRVEDGAITAGSHSENFPKNEFICTEKSYANFDLTLKIKCSGDLETGQVNSGIQIRSARLKNGSVAGYQIDCGKGWFGKIFDEHRRRLLYKTPVDEKALLAGVDTFGWNEYRILADGPNIKVWINNILATDYTEQNPEIPLEGIIAPQIHKGGHVMVQFKDVSIIELPATPNSPTWESLGGVDAALAKVTPKKKPRKKRNASKNKPEPAPQTK